MALCIKNGTHIAQADRLIALGWTRCGCEGCGDSIKGEAWHYSCAASTPDEERLERALVVPLFDLFGFDERLSDDALVILAAAIAKAYREDAG
jgi:hypothetical protein